MSSPTADVSVRVAWADDAAGIAAVQARAWRAAYADLLPPETLATLEPAELAAAWHASMSRPGDARNRVLVALERNRITGFAMTCPAGDPDCDPVADGEIAELTVDPDDQRAGHGSRLLQACVDTLAADKFTRGVVWLAFADDVRRRFLTSAGWAPDGAHRELALTSDETTTVRQVRLHTSW